MKLGGGKEWFTAAELAELRLAGLPNTKRKINERAALEGWHSRTGPSGEPLARPRQARGGGLEYHLLVLPAAVRSALARMGVAAIADVAPTPETQRSRKWSWYEAQTSATRAEAEKRLATIAVVETFERLHMTRTAAIAQAAAQSGFSPATIWEWLGMIAGVELADRLPYLAAQRSGGGKTADVDPEAWQILCSDFLRPEKPTFTSCYYRLRDRWATPKGITLPHERTLRRKLEREIDQRIVVSRRDGAEALRRTIPPQSRTVAGMRAMELVNIDGHRWDVFVRWPDGTIARPMMVAIQDVYSRKFLAHSIGRTESAVETRLAFAHLFRDYGIPAACLMDNGRAFASKWITGGATSRFRFKIKAEEPLGILTALGVKIHWATPYRGQSKPIERGFGEFARVIAKDPAFAGAYVGNRPDAKPENYGSKAVPLARFIEVVEAGIAAHNALPGRRTEMGGGVRSFDQVFDESYASAPIGKATAEQLRLALLAADDRPTDRNNGSISLHGNSYWSEELSAIAGQRVTVRFDPDDLHAPLHVYDRAGRYICSAPVWDATGFLDIDSAKLRARMEANVRNATKALIKAEDLLAADDLADLLPAIATAEGPPEPGAIRALRHRGQTAQQLKPTSQRAPRAAQEAAQAVSMDRLAEGLAKLRSVK